MALVEMAKGCVWKNCLLLLFVFNQFAETAYSQCGGTRLWRNGVCRRCDTDYRVTNNDGHRVCVPCPSGCHNPKGVLLYCSCRNPDHFNTRKSPTTSTITSAIPLTVLTATGFSYSTVKTTPTTRPFTVTSSGSSVTRPLLPASTPADPHKQRPNVNADIRYEVGSVEDNTPIFVLCGILGGIACILGLLYIVWKCTESTSIRGWELFKLIN